MSNYLGHCNETGCEYALFANDEQITHGEDWRKLYAGEARLVTKNGSQVGVYGRCPKNHKTFRLYVIQGKYNPNHKCDDRCRFAKGHDCTCACGGANHGRGYEPAAQASLPSTTIDDGITESQKKFICALLQEREMADDVRENANEMVDGLTKAKASAWIERLLTLDKIRDRIEA